MDALAAMGEEERWASLAYVAGQGVAIDEGERNEVVRRAIVVRAVGGDPHRDLQLDEDAVLRVADELDAPARREQLQVGLGELRALGDGRPAVRESIVALLSNPDLAWRCFAAALVAEELAGE